MADRPTGAGAPATRPSMVEAIGGKRGLVDSGLPVIVFIFVNSVVQAFAERDTALRAALIGAVACGVAIVGLRLARRQSLQQAISGSLGLAVAVVFAARSGEARAFFLPGILINVAYTAAFLGSVVAGWPLVGVAYAAVQGLDRRWRDDLWLRRACTRASLAWAVLFAARVAVQGTLYALDRPGLLAAARLLMGVPMLIIGVALTVAYLRRTTGRTADRPLPDGTLPAGP